MAVPVRYTSQKQQELRSIPQIKERLVEFGWLPTRPDEDLGEDLQVHIYFEGKATGVLFHLQAKSVSNLHERRKDESLPYPFKVKDLTHWEQFELPVVLLVWDVNLREGRWVLWNTAGLQLDRQNPKWREQKTATVYLPWQNRTDDEGLIKLRKEIGRFLFPLLSHGKNQETQIKITIPETEQGKANLTAYDYWRNTGQEVMLKGVEAEFEYPKWYEVWFGKPMPEMGDLTLGPRSSSLVHPVDVSITNANSTLALIQGVELKAIEVGEAGMKLSNEHQENFPLHFCITISELDDYPKGSKRGSVTIGQNNLGSNAFKTREILRFKQQLSRGGSLHLTFLNYQNSPLVLKALPQPDLNPPTDFVELVDHLCLIQDTFGQLFQVPVEGLSYSDVEAIKEVIAIIKSGKTTANNREATLTFQWNGKSFDGLKVIWKFHRQGEPIRFRETHPSSYVELLSKQLQTGRITRYISGNIDMPVADINEAISLVEQGDELKVKIADATVIEIFPDWHIKEAERLAKLLVEKFEVEAVYLFGSLAWGEQWHPRTDIDLAVRGLAPEKYFKAIGYLEGETKFPFDLITLETAPEFLQERILSRGRLLYGKEPLAISE
jgi:predicted nucleotidyltransferase